MGKGGPQHPMGASFGSTRITDPFLSDPLM